MKVGMGTVSGGATEYVEVRNLAELLRKHQASQRVHYVSGPGVMPWMRKRAEAEPDKEFCWGSGREWDPVVFTTLSVMDRAIALARRYNAICSEIRLAERLKSDKLTACLECGGKTVEFSQGPWADYWECLNKACDYKSEYRLGD